VKRISFIDFNFALLLAYHQHRFDSLLFVLAVNT